MLMAEMWILGELYHTCLGLFLFVKSIIATLVANNIDCTYHTFDFTRWTTGGSEWDVSDCKPLGKFNLCAAAVHAAFSRFLFSHAAGSATPGWQMAHVVA